MDKSIEIYILTHKKFDEKYDSSLYKPLLNGSCLWDEDYGYLRDDTGDNISKLNKYFAEYTGQYWAWKNSKSDIIGFCHYRRWFVRNLKFDKLTKKDILSDLEKYDIILPQKRRLTDTVFNTIKESLKINPDYGVKYEDYLILGEVIKNNFPEYYKSFNEVMESKAAYYNTMFISSKELADDYFNWVFNVFDAVCHEIDLSKYPDDNKRVFGFFGEILLNVYVLNKNLKVKEHYVLYNERKFPVLDVAIRRFPKISSAESVIGSFLGKD